MKSADELEVAKDGVNTVCKYTKQDDAVRVVISTLGATQAVYYQVTAEGLRDPQGRIFYNSTGMEPAVSVKLKADKMREIIFDEARSAGGRGEDTIRQSLKLRAQELGLPIGDSNIIFDRFNANYISIVVEYTVPVTFPGGEVHSFHFKHHAANPVF